MLHAIIMAGGAGTRFWPASRAQRPKQLLDLFGGRTMIQATVDRLAGLVDSQRILVVTNQRLVDPIREQLPELSAEAIIGEPCKRDTAPCIGLAAALVRREDPDPTMLVLPADHVIRPVEQFHQTIRQGVELVEAQPQVIATIGILPSYPSGAFGYIERSDERVGDGDDACPAYRVRKFHEKPSPQQAAEYLQTGRFFWNSGIFIWNANTITDALRRLEPQMQAHLDTIEAAVGTQEFAEVFEREFEAIEGKSIDYAVMEKYEPTVVIEASFQWDDVGNWRALARLQGADADGNTSVGRHVGIRSGGCIVRTDDDHLVVTLGMKDCIVVHTPDATLVAHKDDEEALRDVVGLLHEKGWHQYL